MLGLMQNWPLTVDRILDHAARWHGDRTVSSRLPDGSIAETRYADIAHRARKLSSALHALGIVPGDRVATLAWNGARHFEAWYAIMGMGAVCHTLNPRLFPDQIGWIANHAQDRVLIADACFVPLLRPILDACPSIAHVVLLDPADHGITDRTVHLYEDLIAAAGAPVAWGDFPEETACGLCYTSGTTGDPKGVLYSHRSNFLHALMTLQADIFGLSAADVALMVVPMFHANSWGLAFAAPAVGARLVLPGHALDGPSILELLERERVTFSAAVPTVWQGLLAHLRESGARLTTLKRVGIGGSACPEALIRAFHDDYGVEVVHLWGMTEMSPVGTAGALPPELIGRPFEDTIPFRVKQGRPQLGVEMKLTDDAGTPLPHDGKAVGRLKVRGFAVADSYYRVEDRAAWDEEGFFDTGDIATLDPIGTVQITDRSKDVIKSGGEWISSIEIENIAAGHPDVACAAVIAAPHPRWGERPLLLIEPRAGARFDADAIRAHLEGRIARWWMPDEIRAIERVPLGATGKIDKKALRARIAAERDEPSTEA